MDDGGKQPLSYLAADDDAEEVDRRRDARALAVVMAVGAAFVLGVWTVPAVMKAMPTLTWWPIQPGPPPPLPRNTGGSSAEILAAIEAYKDARGAYPASLDQLSPLFLPARPDLRRWRYVAGPSRREYWLHYVGDPPADDE